MSGKKLGSAVTDAERELEAAVGRIEDWSRKNITYEPVCGGISNANWRVRVSGHGASYFVKIPGVGTELFVNRMAAHDAAVKARAAGVGAPVCHFFPDTGVEVFQFVEGHRTATNGDFSTARVRSNAVCALRAFNEGEDLNLQKTLFDMIDEHFVQTLELGGHFPKDFGWINSKYREARQALEASGLDLVPCMNDTLAGNFLLDAEDKVLLVDFEYASNNDRCAELAVWFGEMFFPPDVEAEVIEEYFGRYDEVLSARISLYRALADVKWSTWAMVQQRVSTLDFDFFKYGVWKHLRARCLMYDPRWDDWVYMV